MIKSPNTRWIVAQIGARENYSVARALHRDGRLDALVTDLWIDPSCTMVRLPQRLSERHHYELPRSKVLAMNSTALLRETWDRAQSSRGWATILRRNAWFQKATVKKLRRITDDKPRTIFAYSYAAESIFAYARSKGWTTVLGQIDPGPVEAQMVDRIQREAGQTRTHDIIPDVYWQSWRREVAFADIVMVNSNWSKRCLIEVGIAKDRISVIPLAFEVDAWRAGWDYPLEFSNKRPLRVLFLGQVNLRKGVDLAFDAMRRMPNAPVTLDVVGPIQLEIPAHVHNDRRIQLYGSVPRSSVAEHYARADVFVFPTRSDGFGLTQLEALAAGVPVITSDKCGEVVDDEVNGIVLKSLDAGSIVLAIKSLLADPARVAAMREASCLHDRFSIAALSKRLQCLHSHNDGAKSEVRA